jgi:hypothetical protein
MKHLLALLALVAIAPISQAEVVTYHFAGVTNVGGAPRQFTGVFQYENATPSSTVYYVGNGAQMGFQSTYAGALRLLTISLDNGESVHADVGLINVNNINQSEPGAQIPQGLSLQAHSYGITGSINGQVITGFYLAFLPLNTPFNWDPLDEYFNGNSEALLQANPLILPTTIDPSLTGTALPADLLHVFNAGVFLGTNHGLINTVNSISSFTLVSSCPADLDNGSGTGTTDGGVDINDLLYFLQRFEAGSIAADLDNASGTGTPDGGVDINDLLFFLAHFEQGC